MEEFEPACIWHIRIGGLFIAPGAVPNQGTVWIGEVESGQGAEFPTDQLAEVLQQFYDEAR